MISIFLAILFKIVFPLVFIVAVVDLLTMSRKRKILLMRKSGKTWQQIATHFKVKSPSTVRRWSFA